LAPDAMTARRPSSRRLVIALIKHNDHYRTLSDLTANRPRTQVTFL
jgi:hypothetical protein